MRDMRDASATEAYESAIRLHREGRLPEAEHRYRAALSASPGHAGLLHGLGVLCAQTNRMEEACSQLLSAHGAAPNDLEIRSNLGQALLRLGRAREALPHLLANAATGDASLMRAIGDAMLRLGRFDEAIAWFQKALLARPGFPAALMGLGDAFSVTGRTEDAKGAFETVLSGHPDHAPAHYGLGVVLQQQGLMDEARQAFMRAIALAPNIPAFHRALAETGRFLDGDPRLAALEALTCKPGPEAVELHFALAKAYDDLGRHGDAFAQWSKGNGAKRALVDYDETALMEVFTALERTFTAEVVAAPQGEPSELPIFVVGMPRSGTSLVEQILASHPDVFGAGELTTLNRLVAEGVAGAYPTEVPTAAACRDLAKRYLESIATLAPAAKRIVDKLPGNFLHAGLIHMALPQARIIDVRRDPIDTCFSCWSKLFPGGLDYTYEFGELARYYKAYDRLMAHWRAALPAGVMLEVQYEALVGDFPAEARRLIAFCGLQWDERCLAFHENRRAVRTLSQAQVRQPLFTSSIGRWRPYEQWLHPLIEALR